MFTDLYNTDILSLSSTLENAALTSPDGTARKVSKLCGSWLEIDLNIEGGVVSDCALRVQACALGQASAAILKEAIIGASFEELNSRFWQAWRNIPHAIPRHCSPLRLHWPLLKMRKRARHDS